MKNTGFRMEAVNGVGESGPPPPSPLTGCYLLIVIGEPHSQEHKDIILQRVAKGRLILIKILTGTIKLAIPKTHDYLINKLTKLLKRKEIIHIYYNAKIMRAVLAEAELK